MTETITPYYIKDQGIFIPIINKVLAMKDAFDDEQVKWEDAVKADAPTKEEWYIILYFKNDIQQLLEENGGKPLVDDYYWSSTELSSDGAWFVYFDNSAISYTEKYSRLRVRTLSLVENK